MMCLLCRRLLPWGSAWWDGRSSPVLVPEANPLLGRIEPILVAALRDKVEEVVGGVEHVEPTPIGRIRVEDLTRRIPGEDADACRVLARRPAGRVVVDGGSVRQLLRPEGHIEVIVEIAPRGGD